MNELIMKKRALTKRLLFTRTAKMAPTCP